MKPASRIQATIEVLERVTENTRVPMDTVVGDYMRHRRYIGSKDRSEIAERVYHIARAKARLNWWLERVKAPDSMRSWVIAWLVIGEGVDVKRAGDLFDGSKYAPEELSEAELKLIEDLKGAEITHPDQPSEVRVECPALYEEALKEYFGEDFEAEMAAMIEPATLDLRVNIFTCTIEKAKNLLKDGGVNTEETPLSPWGLRCLGKAYLAKTKAFAKGWVEIQDEGSQLIAYMCGALPGMQVLDYCAGAGGKTLALASAMQRKGRIVAMDNDERRLNKGRARYKKAGVADIIEVRHLEDNAKWLKRQKEKFDIVLLDVPCSGTGTWRRNPDMRWTTYGPSLEDLTAIQAEILEKTHPLVKVGGKLVYATCSLLPAENEQQVERFLKEHPEFEAQAVPENLGKPYMRLTPHRHNTDGFFAAVLVKTS